MLIAYSPTTSTVAPSTTDALLKNLNAKVIFPGTEAEFVFKPMQTLATSAVNDFYKVATVDNCYGRLNYFNRASSKVDY